jgi:hypothetical protein
MTSQNPADVLRRHNTWSEAAIRSRGNDCRAIEKEAAMSDEPESTTGKPMRKLRPCKPLIEDGPFKISASVLKKLELRPFASSIPKGVSGVELVEFYRRERMRFYAYCFQLDREAPIQ